MLIRDTLLIEPIRAGDGTHLREILHPARQAADIGCSLAHAALPPGAASLRHRLAAVEVYYFLAGRGLMHVGGERADVRSGLAVVVPSGAVQWLENTGDSDLEFLCIVDPAWQENGEEILE